MTADFQRISNAPQQCKTLSAPINASPVRYLHANKYLTCKHADKNLLLGEIDSQIWVIV